MGVVQKRLLKKKIQGKMKKYRAVGRLSCQNWNSTP